MVNVIVESTTVFCSSPYNFCYCISISCKVTISLVKFVTLKVRCQNRSDSLFKYIVRNFRINREKIFRKEERKVQSLKEVRSFRVRKSCIREKSITVET